MNVAAQNLLKIISVWLALMLVTCVIAVPTLFIYSWLFFDMAPAATLLCLGGWWHVIKISFGAGTIMVWLKQNNLKFIPIPMKDNKDDAGKDNI